MDYSGMTEEEYVHSLSALTAMHDVRRLAHPYLSKPPNLNASLDQQTLVSFSCTCFDSQLDLCRRPLSAAIL